MVSRRTPPALSQRSPARFLRRPDPHHDPPEPRAVWYATIAAVIAASQPSSLMGSRVRLVRIYSAEALDGGGQELAGASEFGNQPRPRHPRPRPRPRRPRHRLDQAHIGG